MELKIGTKLVVFADSKEGDEAVEMKTSLEGIGEDGRFLISAPLHKAVLYPIHPGDIIHIKIYEKSAVLSFYAKAGKRVRQDGLDYLAIRMIGKISRIQRREDFRLHVMLDGILEYTDPEDEAEKNVRIHTVDVSGGGAALRSSVGFKQGDAVTVYLPLNAAGKKEPRKCEIRRCITSENASSENRYNIGVKFIFETRKQKEELVQYIFKMQREKSKGSKRR